MKTLGIALSAAAIAFAAPAVAQNTDKSQMQENPAPLTQQNHSTSGPEAMGATGWSGPHRGQTSPGHPDAPAADDSPDKQPPVATGADLRGPPKAFPSNKTPE